MKTVITLIILTLITCGCTTSAPYSPPSGPKDLPAVFDLTGTWAGTMTGYDNGIGFNDHAGGTITLVIAEQHGRIFAGNLTVVENGKIIFSSEVAGAVGRDGRTLTIVQESGYSTGEITGTDTLELIYVNDAEQFSVAIDTLRRV
ncbi:MAG: hypothetical protein A4E35_01926 [Methanoregula sp. PtaU1.Bin051]|nr:MAG: hypothetical protein A4E35_01926 [Methanoregula sp. PtaU1.Bin051]